MLEVEDVEDVVCRVDDMETRDYSQSLVRRGWGEGRAYKGTGVEMIEGHCPSLQAAQGCGDTRSPRVEC